MPESPSSAPDPVRKRVSFEPTAIVGRELANAPSRRPASVALGAVFVMGRALVGGLWLFAFAVFWAEFSAEEGIDDDASGFVLWAVLIVGGISTLVLLVLGWLIWRGSNAARVLVMLGLTLSITVAVAGYFTAGEEITIQTTLLTVALDILVLLALSSRDARAWSRRRRTPRG